jgi:tyrosine-protein kinase
VEHGSDAAMSHYLRILRRGLWLVVLTTVLATLGATYASKREQKLYRSSADVYLSNQNLAASLSSVQPAGSEDPVRVAATQADLATTPQVASLALKIAHVTDRTAGELLSRSSVSSSANADILTFSVTDPGQQLAQRLAQAYATAYTRYRRQLDTVAITQALKKADTRLADLKASGEQGSNAYANLLDKEQQLSTLQVLQGSNAQVVRAASGAALTQPKTTRNAALGAILGLVLGIGFALLREAMNTRVRTTGEVEERLDLPLLARIPEPARRLRAKNQLVMLSDPASPAAEAYRILATNLDFVNLERSARTIMISSAQRGEGKSTTVANLAVALARTGRRVVVADMDLRAPSLAAFFDLKEKRGLTDVALGKLALDDALARVPIREYTRRDDSSRNGSGQGLLEVLPAGTVPPNPAEFAGSHMIAELLAQLEERADILLVDAPPLLQLSDAVTLTAKVDALLVVARVALLRRSVLQELRRVLDTAPVAKLGVVVTGVDASEAYGDGYGYGDMGHAPAPAQAGRVQ